MEISAGIGNEAAFFCVSFLCGLGVALTYDVFRIMRRLIQHGTFWVGLEDVCYWTFCTIMVFLLLYYRNDGRLRGYAFFSILLGILVYYLIFGRFIVKVTVKLLEWFIKAIKVFLRFSVGPFAKVGRKIFLFLRKMLKKIYKVLKMGLCKL